MEQQSREGPASARGAGLGARLRKHVVESWPKALLITSIVTILDIQLGWLEPLQQGVLVIAANYVALHGSASSGQSPPVEVVEIDEPTYRQDYHGRSPLDRCVILRQLRAIYDANPSVVALDLDISSDDMQPGAKPLAPDSHASSCATGKGCSCAAGKDCENDCERLLYTEIRQAALEKGISTVALAPESTSAYNKLRRALAIGTVQIADGRLPVTNGFTLDYFATDRSFTEVARALVRDTSGQRSKEDSERPRPAHLDPRSYRDNLKLLPISEFQRPGLETLTNELTADFEALSHSEHPNAPRVVFFGGAFSADDVFLTAIGPVYGVEAQAAAFATARVVPGPRWEFAFDLLLAFSFGFWVDAFWKRYFNDFGSVAAHQRYTAGWRILRFTATVLTVGAGIALATLWVFDWSDIWISPLGLALGMLFDSFIGGLLKGALETHAEVQQGALRMFDAHCRAAGVELRMALISFHETPARPEPPEYFWANLRWRAIGDLRERIKTRAPRITLAAGIADRLLWLALVSFALWLLLNE